MKLHYKYDENKETEFYIVELPLAELENLQLTHKQKQRYFTMTKSKKISGALARLKFIAQLLERK